jgi:hypothetical protein
VTSNRFKVLRAAIERFTFRFVLQQSALGIIVFVLALMWLRIPDASVLDVIATVLFGLVIIAVAGCGQSWLLLKLTNQAPTRSKLLRGAGVLLIAAALWFLCGLLLDHLQADNSLRAGYLNSRFPHSMRNLFSYSHILGFLNALASAANWIVAGILASFAFKTIASPRPLRSLSFAVRSLTYWAVIIVGSFVGAFVVSFLASWTPGHGIFPELTSLIFRLVACVIITAGIVCFVLATLAVLLRKADEGYTTPSGTPEISQPLTADIP